MPKLAGALAVLVLALGLAACGSSDSTTSASTSDTTTAQDAGTGATGQSGSKANGGKSKQVGEKGSKKSGKDSAPPASGKKVKFEAAPLKVSGGGSDQFRTKGGDNSIQEYGEEASETELTEAAEALHNYMVAFASRDWATACSYMSKSMAQGLEHLASKGEGSSTSSCPTIAAGLFGVVNHSSKELHELTEVDAASLRREGEQAFLLYHGPEYDTGTYGPGDLYTMLMVPEGDGWKVGSAIGNQMGIGRRAFAH